MQYNVFDSQERRVKLATDSEREARECCESLNRAAPMLFRYVVIRDGSAAAVALDFCER